VGQFDRRTLLKAGAVVTAGALTSCSDTQTAAAAPNWNSFARSLKGRLYLPSTAGYPAAHQLFNPRWDSVQPAAVVKAANATDVQKAINFARGNKLVMVPKGGGHSYVGASTISKA
jgi:hypothetical protein